MLKAVFFDLDGTLLPLDEDVFIKKYFSLLCRRMSSLGYESDKLIKCIMDGTYAMLKNSGEKTNEEVFWNLFEERYGKEKLKDKAYLDEFYTNEFCEIKEVCLENNLAKELVCFCKKCGLKVILSTNPIFPKVGTLTRMGFIGLKEDDFDFITTYENSYFCKPNPKYFKFLLNKFRLKPGEVIVIGNNVYEDGDCSFACGIKCYVTGDFIIGYDKAKYEYEKIKFEDLINVIKSYL